MRPDLGSERRQDKGPVNGTSVLGTTRRPFLPGHAGRKGHFARFHTISSVRPANVRGFVNFISSAVMDVTIRR
jgi:hypothetical protein